MAVLYSMLLPLGLFLNLRLQFSSTTSTNYSNNCMVFDAVFTTTGPGIETYSNSYESNTTYVVWVPVNSNVSAVVMQAMDKNKNSVGFWQGADKQCNGSSLYYVKNQNDMFLDTNWTSPNSESITEVELQ
ncbi:placenta-expressed transcript 1 protein [Carlito syrichta]|uniref:Placenta-expressed transcript 1 protein n=1 Tax=Carlito syrichta TaxID=1868482 RepID=A0A1U7UU73_CARSF|nr:placenta-expressed transcript 1 protein [Carlito syrichta]